MGLQNAYADKGRACVLLFFLLVSGCHTTPSKPTPRSPTPASRNYKWIQFARGILNPPRLDAQTAAFLKAFEDSLANFRLRQLYELFPYPDRSGWRRMGVMGYLNGDTYHIERRFRGIPQSFGECYIEGGIRSLQTRENKHRLYLQGELHVADFDWDALSDMVRTILTVCETTHVPISETQAMRKLFPQVQNERSLALLAGLQRNYPDTLDYLRRYVTIEEIAANAEHEVKIALQLSLDQANIQRDFPQLHRYLKYMKDRVWSRAEIRDSTGALIAEILFNTEEYRLVVHARAHNGTFMPLSSPTAAPCGYYRIRWQLHFDLWGLLIDFPEIPIRIHYSLSGKRAQARFSLSRIPQVKVSGGLFGFIPPWLVDLVIPSNLQEIAQSFFKTLTAGGRPLLWYQHYPLKRGGNAIRIIWNLEMAENGLLSFAARLYDKRLAMKKKAELELARLGMKLLDALETDLSTLER